MFDFHGDGDSGNSGKGETHLTVSKGQLLTVVNFSQTNSDWVVACTEDGRQGILPFCFAQCCDQFPGESVMITLVLLSLTLFLSLSLSLSLSFSLLLSLSLSPLSFSLPLSLTFSLSISVSFSLLFSLLLSLYLFLSPSLSFSLPLSLTFSLPLPPPSVV